MAVEAYMVNQKTTLKNGKVKLTRVKMYRGIARFKDDTGKWKSKKKGGFTKRSEAQQWGNHYIDTRDGKPNMTFESFYKYYLREIVNNFDDDGKEIKGSTIKTKDIVFQKHLLPYFGNKIMQDVDKKDIRKWRNHMKNQTKKQGKSYSYEYINTCHNQISALFNFGIRNCGLTKNPANEIARLKIDKSIQPRKTYFWTLEQYRIFANEAMENDLDYHLFQVLYWCGLRVNEALSLQIKNVDLKNKKLYIETTWGNYVSLDDDTSQMSYERGLTRPKNGFMRTVPIPQSVAEELEDYISRIYKYNDDTLLFPICKSTIDNHWRSIIKRAKLPYIKLHALRHSHASLLYHQGCSIAQIVDRMGHKSENVTRIYVHVFEEDFSGITNKLDDLMRRSGS